MMSLGYIMALTRAKTAPVMSRAYPIVFMLLVVTCPFTNYYRGGVDTYPFFPRLTDRLLWSGGSFLHLFVHDRLGYMSAALGTALPLHPSVSFGALLAYMFHPVAIALAAPLLYQWHPSVAA